MLVEMVIGSIGVEMTPNSVGDNVYLKSLLCSTATSVTPASGVGTTAVVLATARYYRSVLPP